MGLFRRKKEHRAEPATDTPAAKVCPVLQVANLQGSGDRAEQQDAFGLSLLSEYEEKGLLAVLCDGMGGMEAGREIALACVQDILSAFTLPADADALEAFDDLGPADFPPLLCGRHLLAFVGLEDLGQHRVRIGLALIIIGGERALLVGVETAPDGFDPELVEHVLVVLLGRESDRLLGVGSHAEQAGGDKKECLFHMVCFKTSPKLAISP